MALLAPRSSEQSRAPTSLQTNRPPPLNLSETTTKGTSLDHESPGLTARPTGTKSRLIKPQVATMSPALPTPHLPGGWPTNPRPVPVVQVAAPLASPCFVHSHLDASLGSLKNTINPKLPTLGRIPHSGIRKKLRTHTPTEDESESTADGGSTASGSDYDPDEPSITRQLAETAVVVRDMSKQLGRAQIISVTHSVMIITKARDNHLTKLTREMALWLMQHQSKHSNSGRGLVVYVDQQLKTSKRFDAAGLARDYPELFKPVKKRYSRASSLANMNSATDNALGSLRMTSLSPTSGPSRQQSDPFPGPSNTSEDEGQLRYWTPEMCTTNPEQFDYVITLGGDGTVLFASWLFQHIVPPVIPFALGSLGFLTCFDYLTFPKTLSAAIEDGVRVNLRMRFTCTVYCAVSDKELGSENKCRRRAIRSGKTGEIFMKSLTADGWNTIESGKIEPPSASGKRKRRDKEIRCFTTRPVASFEVLNDLVVDRGPSPYVSQLELFGDEHHMTTVQADGLCVATPTGSTAYSLSAGGSLAHPEIPAILISPICPHTLSFRPMLLPDSMELRICVPYNSRSTAWASFDGRGRIELRQGDHIKVTASKYPFPSVCRENQSIDWFNSLANTLKWNERERQKSFVMIEEEERKKHSRESTTADVSFVEYTSDAVGENGEDSEDESSSESDEEEEPEEVEEYDIDDLSTKNTTSTSSPQTNASDPEITSLPAFKNIFSTSSFSSIDIKEGKHDRYGIKKDFELNLPQSAPPNILSYQALNLSKNLEKVNLNGPSTSRARSKSREPGESGRTFTVIGLDYDSTDSEA